MNNKNPTHYLSHIFFITNCAFIRLLYMNTYISLHRVAYTSLKVLGKIAPNNLV